MTPARGSSTAWVIALLACHVLAGAAQEPSGAPSGAEPVVVVDFENLSGDPALDWIGTGTAASLRADLGRLGFDVLDPDRAAGVPEAARWTVWGSYQRLGSQLRLTAHLRAPQGGGGDRLHTFRVEGPRRDLFDLQDRIAGELRAHMRSARRAPIGGVPPPSAAAAAPAAGVPARAPAAGLAVPAGIIHGPPPPVAPAVINRDADGRATLRAVRVENLNVDGILDDPVYREVPGATDFVTQEPVEGLPATEKTEVWLLFDEDNFYMSVRCWNSAPESSWIIRDIRRDSQNVISGEYIGVLLDTFYDRRSGYNFGINPDAGRLDAQMTDERGFNRDWNPVWELRTGRFEGGWTVEAAFPFKSLRYRPGRDQIWGFNMMRNVQWKNERSFIIPVPAARGPGAIMQASLAPTVVGLEAPEEGLSFEIKPYAIADLTTDRRADPRTLNELHGDGGLDVKYGVTRNLVADLTVNTDFAQVEADEQQVNLTRFSLFFPEKREFFLENQGVFTFGGAQAGPFGTQGETPVLFYSRRIGLAEGGREVPIDAGARLSGRVGAFSVGMLNIQTDDEAVSGTPATNFSVVRLKRDILRRSSVGALYTRRSVSRRNLGSSETYGLDAQLGFYDALTINTYWARTDTLGLEDDVSYRAQLDYEGDRYGVQVERLVVGDDFNPEVGFLRRDDFEQSRGYFRFSPRLHGSRVIRRLFWEGRFDYFTTRAGILETRQAQGRFAVEFESSDEIDVTYTRNYEFLDEPFHIARNLGVAVPVGGYDFDDVRVALTLGPQHRLAGQVAVQRGGFFGGERTSLDLMRGSFQISRRLQLEPGVSFNWIDLPQGRFRTDLATTRTTFTFTPLMFVSALVQYNSSNNSLGANVRMRWEYQPGSELFVVYNEQRDTLLPQRFPELENRTFVIKFNRLFRF